MRRTLATAAIVLAAALPCTGARAATTDRVTGTYAGIGNVLQPAGKPAVLCLAGVLAADPPTGCAGVPLPGVVAATLPTAHRYSNGTVFTQPVRVVGAWNGSTLTPTGPIAPAAQPPVAPYKPLTTACAHPGGRTLTARQRDAQLQALFAAAAQQVDWSFDYVSKNGAVANVAFTGNLRAHEAALRTVYAGPLCVIHGNRSATSLLTLQQQLTRDMRLIRDHGVVIFSYGPTLDRFAIVVAVADERGLSFLQQRYGTLQVTALLVPIAG